MTSVNPPFPPLFFSLKDDMEGIRINSKQKITLMLQNGISKGREFNIFENFIRKHRNANHDSLKYIQFQLDEPELSWSGPVCIASLGCFFVKFRKQKSNQTTAADTHITEFAAVCVVEKGSSLVLHFQKPPDSSLPYRIENGLRDVAITFYQQASYYSIFLTHLQIGIFVCKFIFFFLFSFAIIT